MKRAISTVLGAALVVGLLAAGGSATAAATMPPSLRLVPTQEHVHLQRLGDQVHLDLGVYAAAVGGAFRIDVRRDGWTGPITATQGGRVVPADLLDGFGGMKGFVRVAFADAATGRTVARTSVTFCPNGWDRQRIDDSGPRQPTFPDGCPSTFPFTRSMVWGIDAGWATVVSQPAVDGGVGIDVPPGDYDVTVRVAPAWAKALSIPPGDRSVQLRVTVVEAEEPEEPRPIDATADMGHRVHARTMAAAPPTGRLPDLVALPAWRLSTEAEGRRDLLSFASTPWNAGPGPFVVEGFRRRGSDRVMDAFQYFSDADGDVVGRAPIGELAYHPGGGHDHWHFLQFAAFDLLSPDGETVVRSQKQGFCMAATDPVDLALPGAVLRPYATDLGSACGGPRALWVREVLPPGWGDTYFNVSGQAFDITRVPNGRYLVRVQVDPMRALHQTRTDNDAAVREVVLGGERGARTVAVLPWNGVEDTPFHAPEPG